MTISDLIKRMTFHQKELGPAVQVKIGKEYSSTQNVFDFFEIKVVIDNKEKEIILVPSDIWEKDAEKRRK